jgi:transcriptional regulator with XRE-family HTH domain
LFDSHSVASKLTKDVGSRIRDLREGLRLSQEAFADKAGLHRTYIGSLERGERNPSIETLDRVANALSVPLKDLLPEVKHG